MLEVNILFLKQSVQLEIFKYYLFVIQLFYFVASARQNVFKQTNLNSNCHYIQSY